MWAHVSILLATVGVTLNLCIFMKVDFLFIKFTETVTLKIFENFNFDFAYQDYLKDVMSRLCKILRL